MMISIYLQCKLVNKAIAEAMSPSKRSPKTPTEARSRPSLDRPGILREALKLADELGVESLSMRRLALELEVEAMSLYNHVKNKEEILDGIVDLVAAEFELPDTTAHWKPAMRARCISAHQVLLKHPWAALMMFSRVNTGPALMTWANATLGCLMNAGFNCEMTDHASNALDNHLYGFTLQRVNSPIDPDEYASAAEHYLPVIKKELYPHLHAMATSISDGSHNGINDFNFGLDLLLDGLERVLVADQTHHS